MFKRIHVFRVKPGQELLAVLSRYCEEQRITSAIVLGIIGSVERARLSFLTELPGNYDSVEYAGPLEIVCAQGSVAQKGRETLAHVHIQLSSKDQCRGGHLAEAVVFSTAEVTLGELSQQLTREMDRHTGLNELAL